ncbi:hypothetical protein [Aquimarina sp. I32.4]|nr:hypothetical protein [Aquimarina sp. I32.4]
MFIAIKREFVFLIQIFGFLQCIGLASEESKETGTWAIVKPVTEI